jgi:hypothetical protein
MLEAFSQIQNTGSIQDVEVFKNRMRAIGLKIKAKKEDEMRSSKDNAYSQTAYDNMLTGIDDLVSDYEVLIDNQDAAKVMQRSLGLLQDTAATAMFLIAPGAATLAPLGENFMKSYIDLQAAGRGDPRIMAELVKINPEYTFLNNVQMDLEKIAPALKAAAGLRLGVAVETGEVDEETGKAVAKAAALDIQSGRTDVKEAGNVLQNLMDVDMPVTALSTAANTPGSYDNASDGQRDQLSTVFRNAHNQQVQNLSTKLSASGYQLAWNGKQFSVVDPRGRDVSELDPTGEFEIQMSGGMSDLFGAKGGPRRAQAASRRLAEQTGSLDQLNFLNDQMLNLAKDNRWASKFGYEDANDWASTMINSVNLGSAAVGTVQGTPGIVGVIGEEASQALSVALQGGDTQRAVEILMGRGIGSQSVTGASDGTSSRPFGGSLIRDASGRVSGSTFDVNNPDAAPAAGSVELVPGPFNRNPVPAGIPQGEAIVIDMEGKHDVNAAGWDGKTVGWGRDLETNPLSSEEYTMLGLPETATNKEIGQKLFEDDGLAYDFFKKTYGDIKAETDRLFGEELAGLDEVRKDVIYNAAYAMGPAGIAAFKDMREALKDGDYSEAAKQLLLNSKGTGKSDFAKTHGRRALFLAQALMSGRFS